MLKPQAPIFSEKSLKPFLDHVRNAYTVVLEFWGAFLKVVVLES